MTSLQPTLIRPRPITVALAGNPNAGKSTLFNSLTGSRQHVGNWPGKTVEKKTGTLAYDGRSLAITDLPGAYSLSAYTMEEVVARDFILDERPDVVVAVTDAANLERNLYLVVQLLEFERPGVIVLNMMDSAARRGLIFDLPVLGRALASPIVPATARRDEGVADVLAAAVAAAAQPGATFRLDYGPDLEREIANMLAEAAQYPAIRDAWPPRWLALKLLEGDTELSGKVEALPGGRELLAAADGGRARLELALGEEADTAIADRRYAWIHELVGRAVRAERRDGVTVSDRIDRYLTHRRLGIPIFLLAMWIVFKTTTDLAAPWVRWLDGALTGPVSRWTLVALAGVGLERTWLASLLLNGVIAGVGGVVAFVPVLVSLYFALAVLEDSGYMARGAFVMDRLMNRVGLHGRSFLPLMLGFGCSVPAIYATRTLTNQRDRILTGLLVPFMSCGARLPVYLLFAAVFFPGRTGLIILGLYLAGIIAALLAGLALQRTILPRTTAPALVMELPPYRLPGARNIWFHVRQRTQAFLKHAGSLILLAALVIWLLTATPLGGGKFAATAMEDSAFGRLSAATSPALRPLGFGGWQAGGALIGGLVAKEVVVSTLAQTYGTDLGASVTTTGSLGGDLRALGASFVQAGADTMRAIPGIFGIDVGGGADSAAAPALARSLREGFAATSGGHAAAAGLAFMVFVLLYTPCMATLAAERAEMGTRWMALSFLGQLAIAWLAAFVVFRTGVWLGGG